jgi:lipocalin
VPATNGTCAPGTNDGFWLFHRDPEPPAEVVAQMRSKATELGFDVSVLQKVNQTGCVYTNSTLD